MKSTLTSDILAALTSQYEVLDAIDAFRAQDNKPPLQPPFYACSLPIGPGPEVSRGSGGQTREIVPPVAATPQPVTRDHIIAHWCRREWLPAIENRIDDTIRWSVRTSQLIAQGQSDQGQAQPDY